MADKVEIQQVKTRQDLEAFIRLPFQLYRNDPNWVPPLLSERRAFFDPKHNPFFDHATVTLWLARRNGQVVGRISAHIDHLYNEFHGEKIGAFGFLETINDYAVAEALLSTARDWVKSQGMTTLRGPLNFSTNHEVGLMIQTTGRPPTIMMPYNALYYADFCDRFGLSKVVDAYAYLADLSQFHGDPSGLPRKIQRVAERMKEHAGLTARLPNMKDFDGELRRLKVVYNRAWEKNWAFVPLTDAEIDSMADDLRSVINPKLCVFVEAAGEPVGVSICLPDFNQVLKHLNGRLFPLGWLKALWYMRRITHCRLLIMGVTEEYRGRGVEAVLIHETLKAALLNGFTSIEFSWILETNEPMNRIVHNLGTEYGTHVHSTYRIYQMSV